MPEGSLLVVSPNWLGDAVMALPALADIRHHFADARLIVVARRSVADLFRLVPGVDDVVTAEWQGTWWRRRALEGDVTRLRDTGATTAILFPNSFASALAPNRAGIAVWGYASDLRSRLLSRTVRRPKTPLHQGDYYRHLVRELGIATGSLEPMLSIPPAAVAEAQALLAERGWDGISSLVALAPGAAYGKAKQWPPSHVVRLATDLTHQSGSTCVLVGSRGDGDTTAAIRRAVPRECQPRVLDLAGATTLPVLAAVLSLSRACVSNDSGAMHLAAAAGAPVVAVFGPTDERATRPLTRGGARAEVVSAPVWCRPCMLRECPIDHRCMTRIEPRDVLAALSRV
jgi:heptosyltransferase-2